MWHPEKGTAIDGRTIRHIGYKISQIKRKMVEEPFGWAKTIGNMRRSRYFGLARTGFSFILCMAAYDLVRMRKLIY